MNKMTKKRSAAKAIRRSFYATAAGALMAAGLTVSPASAYSQTCGKYGDSPSFACVAFSGFSGQQTWGYPVDSNGHNCTNYVSYRLNQNGVKNPGNLGNAKDWNDNATRYGLRVDNRPAVGSVAVWEAGSGLAGSFGHVAYVDAVADSYIDVSEDNYGGTSMRKRYFVGQWGWPNSFVHFNDVNSSAPRDQASVTSQYVMIHQGGNINVKVGLNDSWVKILSSQAADIQAAGNRFFFRDSNKQLWGKEGVSGTWYHLADWVDEYQPIG